MSRPLQTYTFATRNDMSPGIGRFEAGRPLAYVLCDEHASPNPPVLESLMAFEDLGQNKSGKAIGSPAFLVSPRGEPVKTQRISRPGGRVSYDVTQMGNPRSVVLMPSGLFDSDTLVAGNVATISSSPESVSLYKYIVGELTAAFTKVGIYWVGPEALRMLDEGKRLVTIGVRSPREYDLRQPRP